MTTITSKQSESLHARIPSNTVESIDHLARASGRSRNWVFNEALKQYLEVQQWQIDVIKERLRDAQNSKTKFISHSEVMKRQKKRLEKKLGI